MDQLEEFAVEGERLTVGLSQGSEQRGVVDKYLHGFSPEEFAEVPDGLGCCARLKE